MKFLGCSRCFSSVDETNVGSSRKEHHTTDNCDPLLITKRPAPKLTNREKSARKHSIVTGSKFPIVLRALGAPWQRDRRRNKPKVRLETRRKVKKRDLLRDKQEADPNEDKSVSQIRCSNPFSSDRAEIVRVFSKEPRRIDLKIGTEENRDSPSLTDPQDFERDYNEHLEALKILLENESPFENAEERRNSRNNLSTLDFRRINTIALPDNNSWNDTVWDVLDFRENLQIFNEGATGKMLHMLASDDASARGKLFKESVDHVIRENRKIEEVVLSLMGREPTLKKTKSCLSREGSPAGRKEAKTVRFKVEGASDDDRQREIGKVEKTRNFHAETDHLSGFGNRQTTMEEKNAEIAVDTMNRVKKSIPIGSMDSKTVTIKIEADQSKNEETEEKIFHVEPTTNDLHPKTARSTTIVMIYQQVEESRKNRIGSVEALGSKNVMEPDGMASNINRYYIIRFFSSAKSSQ